MKKVSSYKCLWSANDNSKSRLDLYVDDWNMLWLVPIKGLKTKIKLPDFFLLSEEDVKRLSDWYYRKPEEIKDGDSIRVTCGCLGHCSIMEFIVNKPDENVAMSLFVETYMHMSYFKNFTRKMAPEVVLLYSDIGNMLHAIEEYNISYKKLED